MTETNANEEQVVLGSVHGRVGIVTLNRPIKRNAINVPLLRGVRRLLADFEIDPEIRAVVLTGSGDAFCAGMDLYALDDWRDDTVVLWDDACQFTSPWAPMSKPLVCAANGPTATGGLEFALACDFIVASDRAKFADTHGRAGFIPGWGLTVRLPLAVGVRRAREMSLTARYVEADEALRIGLVEHVCPHDELLTTAIGIAATIAENDPSVVRAYLDLYRAVEAEIVASAFDREATHMQVHNAAHRPSDDAADRAAGIVERGRHGAVEQ